VDVSSPERLPVVVLSCQVLQDLLIRAVPRVLPEDMVQEIIFMDYGLHRVPGKMTLTLQETLDRLAEPSLVVLGYGLCGNGLQGLRAGKHTLLAPRVDDCIALLLGSRQAYVREFEAVPGTYYLSKGWLESGSHPLKEYKEYVPKYGADQAMWIMDQQYQHYERLVLVAHSQADLETYRPQAHEVAHFCERWGMRYEEILGSDRYVQRLVEVAAALDTAAECPAPAHWAGRLRPGDGDFLVIPPGGEIRQEQFIR
jgi:hypothetical protein